MNRISKPNVKNIKPPWLKRRIPADRGYEAVNVLLNKNRLNTVCQQATCPNLWECFSRQTATFLIMGSSCTRNCRFCAVAYGPKSPPDPDEPARVAKAVQSLGLRYAVITSVTRDDLSDGGASFFAHTIEEIRRRTPDTIVEALIPDFQGNSNAVRTIVAARPAVINHNIETVARLYAAVRPQAIYHRSLRLLKQVKTFDAKIITKSGLMLGLGERSDELHTALQDLRDAGCRLLTLGQYLQPTPAHLPIDRFVHPEEFDDWREIALEMRFAEVAAGPFVRSSYQAQKLYQAV